MKQKIVWIAAGCLLACCIFVMVLQSSETPVPEFSSSSDVQFGLFYFPSDKNVGEILDADTAIEKAKALWIEEFSTRNGKPYNPINDLPIEANYDTEEAYWIVNGTLPDDCLGSVPIAIIAPDGDVSAVWMG